MVLEVGAAASVSGLRRALPSAAGSSWTSRPTLLPATRSTTVCPSSATATFWPSTACCGTTRRGLASTSPATGGAQMEAAASAWLPAFKPACSWLQRSQGRRQATLRQDGHAAGLPGAARTQARGRHPLVQPQPDQLQVRGVHDQVGALPC